MRVSILAITYNQENFIDEAISSALAQDWPSVEVVVADDGSTDGTRSRLRELKRRAGGKVRLVLGENNVGITGNCNRGLRECRGELIAMLGGDDLLSPSKISSQVRWFAASGRRVLCSHDTEHFDSTTGQVLHRDSDWVRQLEEEVGAARLCSGELFYAGSSVMFRSEAAPSRGFDERLPMVSDLKFYVDTIGRSGVHGALPGVLSRYRHHGGNVSFARLEQLNRELDLSREFISKEQPWFLSACRKGIGRQDYKRGCDYIRLGDLRLARAAFLRSMRLGAGGSARPKALGWLALTLLPTKVSMSIVHLRSSLKNANGSGVASAN